MPRAIRLKEFPRSTVISNTPPDWYAAARDPSLVQQRTKSLRMTMASFCLTPWVIQMTPR